MAHACGASCLPCAMPAPPPRHLHHGGRAARPPVLLIHQPCQAEGAPRLGQVPVQVPHRHQPGHGRKHQRRRRRRRRCRRPGRCRAACVQHVCERVHKGVPQLQGAGAGSSIERAHRMMPEGQHRQRAAAAVAAPAVATALRSQGALTRFTSGSAELGAPAESRQGRLGAQETVVQTAWATCCLQSPDTLSCLRSPNAMPASEGRVSNEEPALPGRNAEHQFSLYAVLHTLCRVVL